MLQVACATSLPSSFAFLALEERSDVLCETHSPWVQGLVHPWSVLAKARTRCPAGCCFCRSRSCNHPGLQRSLLPSAKTWFSVTVSSIDSKPSMLVPIGFLIHNLLVMPSHFGIGWIKGHFLSSSRNLRVWFLNTASLQMAQTSQSVYIYISLNASTLHLTPAILLLS